MRLISSLRTAMPGRLEHALRTAHEPRADALVSATIESIKRGNMSGSVVNMLLSLDESAQKRFKFEAGQWVDMHIPNVKTIGGFSMTSDPNDVQQKGTLELAVKKSKHPPAEWCHSKAKKGDKVEIRSGGSVFFPPSASNLEVDRVTFLAGGVGINPYMSALRLLDGLRRENGKTPKVQLLYSSKCEELQFATELAEMAWLQRKPNSIQLFLTGDRAHLPSFPSIQDRRVTTSDLKEALSGDYQKQLLYICGPPDMTDYFEAYVLNQLQFPKDRLMIEKWW